ncbi:hypothetical protein GOV13_01410 [Candidatus Pacearchaeota archaeon]|nr:hypothetical protein [Candidatus Pacearchaeota archaeon]
MPKKFLRRTSSRYVKLGKGVKKNQKWRRPTGRDNKMREKRRGYPKVVSVGYKNPEESRGKIKRRSAYPEARNEGAKQPVIIKNVQELEKVGKNQIAVIGKVGKKKKMEITTIAKQKKIQIHNLNVEKFLKQNKPKKKEKESDKKEVSETKSENKKK